MAAMGALDLPLLETRRVVTQTCCKVEILAARAFHLEQAHRDPACFGRNQQSPQLLTTGGFARKLEMDMIDPTKLQAIEALVEGLDSAPLRGADFPRICRIDARVSPNRRAYGEGDREEGKVQWRCGHGVRLIGRLAPLSECARERTTLRG